MWFLALAALGIPWIFREPHVFAALSPHHGARFLATEGYDGFLILGSVFLVVTGGEALYADMGHFGRRPIRLTWFLLVMPALLIHYFGQGAFLLTNPQGVENPFFLMAPSWALYPLIALSTAATIIASQAVISGAFSLTRQASMLGFWPRVRVEHTSAQEIGQVYVPSINWALMVATVALVLGFRSSSALAAAYGIAVTLTMLITTLLAYVVARDTWGWSRFRAFGLSSLFVLIDLSFFLSNATKFADGGWFPIGVAAAILVLMTTWRHGRERLRDLLFARLVSLDDFFELLHVERIARVPGTAVYMVSYTERAPSTLMLNAFHHRAVHENVVLLTIQIEESPRINEDERVRVEPLGHGFTRIIARFGFMEQPDVPALLARKDTPTPPLEYTTFFLGRETVLAVGGPGMHRLRKMLVAFMARNAQQAQGFFGPKRRRLGHPG
jgi:KUP system potassium uptake protein